MKSKKKGFTLIELIIVLTIIGILSAIVIPSWGYFMRRSRERTANSRAKIVFNAAQTEITRIAQRERPLVNYSDPIYFVDTTLQDAAKQQLYVGKDDFYFYWDGKEGYVVDASGNKKASQKTHENVSFANAVNNICGTEGLYKVYVKNYTVQSVVYSAVANGTYKGTYPRTMGANQLTDAIEKNIRTQSLDRVKMGNLMIDQDANV